MLSFICVCIHIQCILIICFTREDINSESEWMENDSSCKPKVRGNSYFYIRQNRLSKTMRSKKGHYIMNKGSSQHKDTMLLWVYTLNVGALNFIKQNIIFQEIICNMVSVGNLSTPLLSMGKSIKKSDQKKKSRKQVNYNTDQIF